MPPARAEVPLQIADPQHQFGDGGGARVDLDAEELVRIDGVAAEPSAAPPGRQDRAAPPALRLPAASSVPARHRGSCRSRRPGSSTRMSHSSSWNAFTSAMPRPCVSPSARRRLGRGLHVAPVRAQRLDDGRHHQPLDIGARRVVRAELAALVGVERVLQQRAEDRGLDLAPVLLRGLVAVRRSLRGRAAAPWRPRTGCR